MKLFLASVFTLSILSAFLGTIVFAFLYVMGHISSLMLVFLVIMLNFILWLVTPAISDFIYFHFFHARWMTLEELGKKSRSSLEIIEAVCHRYGFPSPKLGVIADKNPNAFTYGSGRWNARVIVTEGIFEYLDDRKISSVYAHELGHIKNRDFIVMTVASTIVDLLYVFYIIGKSAAKGKGSGKGKGYIVLIGLVSYLFYWIGQYMLLFLSRVREYYADQFSAEETKDPNLLATALINIAYGILTNPDDVRLVKTTKNIGIMDFSAAEHFGMTYYMSKNLKERSMVDKTFLYDLHNPWARVAELSSTHPLTGKRIRRLSEMSMKSGIKPVFDFETIERRYPVDKWRLRKNFAKDLTVLLLPVIGAILFPVIYAALYLTGIMLAFNLLELLSGWLSIIGLAVIVKTIYKYPGGKGERLTILDMMNDIYASPVRGRRVILDGKFIGRGVPGFIFSEDLMIQDRTGLMYLNYESWLPILGKILFAWRRVGKLVGKAASVNGWFLRSIGSWIDIGKMTVDDKGIRSYMRFFGFFWGAVFIITGLFIYQMMPGTVMVHAGEPANLSDMSITVQPFQTFESIGVTSRDSMLNATRMAGEGKVFLVAEVEAVKKRSYTVLLLSDFVLRERFGQSYPCQDPEGSSFVGYSNVPILIPIAKGRLVFEVPEGTQERKLFLIYSRAWAFGPNAAVWEME